MVPFVEKGAEYATSKPEFTPPFVEVAEMNIDLKAVDDLTQV